jgi:hypothetical protein
MTRGSTGKAKVLPATKIHLKQIFTCGARALVNHALRENDFELFTGNILNLNFPSAVHMMKLNGQEITYGYSSGTYARALEKARHQHRQGNSRLMHRKKLSA